MAEGSDFSRIQKWLLIYLGLCLLGAFVLFGGLLPRELFASWEWWQRALLIFCAGPFATAAYLLAQVFLEGAMGVIFLGFKHAPLQTAAILSVLAAVVGIVASPF